MKQRSGALLPLALLGGLTLSGGQARAATLPGPDTQAADFQCEASGPKTQVCRMTDAAKETYLRAHPPRHLPPMEPTLLPTFAATLPGPDGAPAPYNCSLLGADRSVNLAYTCVSREARGMKRTAPQAAAPARQELPLLPLAAAAGGVIALGAAGLRLTQRTR
ncbi:MAG: hypothetical protein PW734_03015 [Verrucomicrobium sp.]|nr:hypothetical protein [Verrucomicrobium sp.]